MDKLFPDEIVIETERFTIAQDWEIPIPAFFIVSAKRSIRSITDFTPEEANEFMMLLVRVRLGMSDVLGITDAYLFQNEDSAHGFHIWVFPRHAWMEKFGRKIESVRPIMEYAKAHLRDKETLRDVHDAAREMSEYMRQALYKRDEET